MMNNKQTFRPFDPTSAEYEAAVHVYNLANPHAADSAKSWQHWDQNRDPSRQFTRYVAEQEGVIVGYGYSVRTDRMANKYRFAIHLLPSWETAELIDNFFSYIMAHCLEQAPTAIFCEVREDEPEKISWLRKQGFQIAMRYPHSMLTLSDFNPAAFSGLLSKVAAQGIEIISLAELKAREPEWKKRAYELEMLLSKDVPMSTIFVPTPFEHYAQSIYKDPGFLPQLWLIALDGDAYIGMTNLYKNGDKMEMLINGLTGVRREYRRRGLATALKVQVIELAQKLGARQIQTSNEENNPMFDLNLQLGFKAQPADVEWEKVV